MISEIDKISEALSQALGEELSSVLKKVRVKYLRHVEGKMLLLIDTASLGQFELLEKNVPLIKANLELISGMQSQVEIFYCDKLIKGGCDEECTKSCRVYQPNSCSYPDNKLSFLKI